MNVSAILVTRGNVDMQPVLDSLPDEWEVLVWDNGTTTLRRWFYNGDLWQKDMSVKDEQVADLSVYGRYAALEWCSHETIYVQDDDCIVSDPQAIVDALLAPVSVEWGEDGEVVTRADYYGRVVCNMPERFRHDFYEDNALVGFGACFHCDAPERAFVTFHGASFEGIIKTPSTDVFERTCDIVFTGLTPIILVDVEKHDRDFAFADDRMYRQPEHVAERQRMRELVAKVRDA